MRNCTRDEGRSFEAGNQVQASNHCKLLSSKAMVVSVAVNVGMISRRVRLREASASEPSMNCRKRIRRCQNRGVTLPPGSVRGDVLILPERHPAYRRREAQPGSCTERENLCCDAKGEIASGSNREDRSTEAQRRDGAARSSEERSCNGARAKGLHCSALSIGQPPAGGADGQGEAVQHPQTGSVGGLQACEGQPGSGWRRRAVD